MRRIVLMIAAVALSAAPAFADYYSGKKHCYTRGSATICN